MQVKLLKEWNGNKAGEVVEVNSAIAKELVKTEYGYWALQFAIDRGETDTKEKKEVPIKSEKVSNAGPNRKK